jgi:cysteine synthase
MSESIVPKIFDRSLIDETIIVNDDEAYKSSRWLAKKHGILGGMSTGANVHAALKIAEKLDYGIIVVISPDGGFKYLSTDLFNGD